MDGSSSDFLSNPTIKRLEWLRQLFLPKTCSVLQPSSGIKFLDAKVTIPKPGVILVAPPMMHDPNFRRSVVLLCEHSPEGSLGLILNRPLGVHLAEVVPGIDGHEHPLVQGGPVQTDTLHFLHTFGELVPDSKPVGNGIYWGGDFEMMKMLIETGRVSRSESRFFLGYSGWSPGQLLEEINQGGWILSPGDAEAVFKSDASNLWRSVLRRMGGEYAILSNFPEDPRLN
jgi:putative transcriptional regulator